MPGLHKVYTSNWGEEKIGVIDLRRMEVVKRLPTAEKPNGSAYATEYRRVYVSNTNGKAMAIVNVDTDAIVKTRKFKVSIATRQSAIVFASIWSSDQLSAYHPSAISRGSP